MGRPSNPKRRSTIFLVLGVVCFFVASTAFGMGFSSGPWTLSKSEESFIVIGFPTSMLLGIILFVIGIVLHARENRDRMDS